MSLEFARTSIIGRSAGHSVVKAAAYRSGERLKDERIGRTADYSHRANEVAASEIILPAGADQKYLDRHTLWTAVEDREDLSNNRANAQLAKDHVIALPRELSIDQQIELARGFAQEQFVSKGLVVDMNIHLHSDGNPHAHLLTTTRNLEGSEFGLKNREANGAFHSGKKIPPEQQLRHSWADYQNKYFKEHDIDALVTNNNGEFEAEVHLGKAKWAEKNGEFSTKVEINKSRIAGRSAVLLEKPEIVINRVADRKAVFTRHDLYRELHRLVDDPAVFAAIKSKIENHHSLQSVDPKENKYFTTSEIQDTELNIAGIGQLLSEKSDGFEIPKELIDQATQKQEFLSEEQSLAVSYVCGAERLACVVGLAGAGKSTMLNAVNDAASANGSNVSGIALAGKAAEELTKSSDIESRTIASWLLGVQNGTVQIERGDIIVMDEAGMVNNKTMNRVLNTVNNAGAKLVLVGDGEQLQPIQAGSPFRTLATKFGSADIETIRRQRTDWQREATFNLAKGKGSLAFDAYDKAGLVSSMPRQLLLKQMVSDYVSDFGNGSQAILAHRNNDVKAINQLVRDQLKSSGNLEDGLIFKAGQASSGTGLPLGTQAGDNLVFTNSNAESGYESGDRATFVSSNGSAHTLQLSNGDQLVFTEEDAPGLQFEDAPKASDIELSVGDRILFTKNDSVLGVKNGMLGTLESFEDGVVSIAIDEGNRVSFSAEEYSNIDHGYATTIHKSQGMTVDNSYVYGSGTMDKHLGYVALSRHRDNVQIYLDSDSIGKNQFAGQLEKANRQQNVLEYAEERGSEIDQIIKTNEVFTMENAIATESYQDNLTVTESQQTLANARSLIEQQLIAKAQLEINNAETKSRQAERVYENHKAQEPKQGLFASKTKHAEWQSKLNSLEKESFSAKKSLHSLKTQFQTGQESLKREAKLQAETKHPDEAALVKTARSVEKTNELIDRLDELEKQRDTLSDSMSPQERSAAIDKIDRTVKQLQGEGVLLDNKQAVRVKESANKVSKEQRQMAKERGRGGHEL